MRQHVLALGTVLLALALALPAAAANARAESARGARDLAVGAGQTVSFCGDPDTPTNFAVSAHVPTGTPPVSGGAAQPGAGGTIHFTIPESAGPACQAGQFVAKVDCMVVTASPSGGGIAEITARSVTSSGIFRFAFGPPGTEVYVQVSDSGTNEGDTIPIQSTLPEPCAFFIPSPFPVLRGNLTVRSGA